MIFYQVHELWDSYCDSETYTWYRSKKEALAHYSRIMSGYRRDWRGFERACVEELRGSLSACEVDEPDHLISIRVHRAEVNPGKAGIVGALNGRFDRWDLIKETDLDLLHEIAAGVARRLAEFTEGLD